MLGHSFVPLFWLKSTGLVFAFFASLLIIFLYQ
jgi:hypothetical protein